MLPREILTQNGSGEMESVNYTYEFDEQRLAWWIIGNNGRKLAEATNEQNAELIVAALNGVAP